MSDCSMLWFESLGLTNAVRAALACVLVFLLAALSQYLTTSNDCQLQQSEELARRRLYIALEKRKRSPIFYDPALSDGCDQTCKDDNAGKPPTPGTLARKTFTHLTPDSTHSSFALQKMPPLSVKVGNWTHFGDALMRGGRALLAYMLMLVVMTYDLTLITSIVMGYMASSYIFGKDTANVPESADPCCS